MTINDFIFAQHESKKAYLFVFDNDSTAYINTNLRNWAEDEMYLTPKSFADKVAGLISHETLHVVLDRTASVRTSNKLDNLFGTSLMDEIDSNGLLGFDRRFRPAKFSKRS